MVPRGQHVDGLALGLRSVLGRTHLDAEPTAGAVIGCHLHDVLETFELGGVLLGHVSERLGCAGSGDGFEHLRADRRVWADHRAPVALHTQFRFPDGDLQCDGALLVAARSGGPGAVGWERTDRQAIAVTLEQQTRDVLDEIGCIGGHHGRAAPLGVGGADRYLVQLGEGGVDGLEVPALDLGSALGPGVDHGLLHRGDRLVAGQYSRQCEEAGRHDGVDASTQAARIGHPIGVDREESALSLREQLLGLAGQAGPELVGGDGGVEKHGGAHVGHLEHIEAFEEPGVVHGYEAGALDLMGGADRARAEPQVRHGGGPGLLGVVDEVALAPQVGGASDDPDGCLVAADGAVGSEAEDHRPGHVVGLDVEVVVDRE